MSTLSELRTRARQRVDAVDNNFFTDSEIDDYINVGLGELHDLLVLKYEDQYVNQMSFSLVADQDTYRFADIGLSNFYKLLGVDAVHGNDVVRVRRFSFQDRNRYQADTAIHNSNGYADYEYSLRASSIVFTPKPTSTDIIKVWYVPKFAELDSDTSTVDDMVMLNWEEYAILVAAIKMRQKEETSITPLQQDLDRITLRIEDASRDRDASEPTGITDESAGVMPYHRWMF